MSVLLVDRITTRVLVAQQQNVLVRENRVVRVLQQTDQSVVIVMGAPQAVAGPPGSTRVEINLPFPGSYAADLFLVSFLVTEEITVVPGECAALADGPPQGACSIVITKDEPQAVLPRTPFVQVDFTPGAAPRAGVFSVLPATLPPGFYRCYGPLLGDAQFADATVVLVGHR